jgi:hypothetical protein
MHGMKKTIAAVLLLSLIGKVEIYGQSRTENVIIITLDGFRWKEVFRGADPGLLNRSEKKQNLQNKALYFWDSNPEVRRQLLMPFLWTEVAAKGVLYGNRDYGCRVGVANRYWFSYPGYHEMLTGNPHRSINSNSLGPDPDTTVLEKINKMPGFENRVAVFSSWGEFNDIVNEHRSNIFVNSGYSLIPGSMATPEQLKIESTYPLIPKVIGTVRYDGLTFMEAFEYLKTNKPRVLMIALGETDEFGHEGLYDQYLQSAHRTDGYLEMLWKWIQSDDTYRDKTTLLITSDHGRGNGRAWRKHGRLTPHSNETWIAMLGPAVKPLGEIRVKGNFYNAQVAQTIAALLQVPYRGNNPNYAQIPEQVNQKSDILAHKTNPEP